MGPRTSVAAADRRAGALRTGRGARSASLPGRDGTVREYDPIAARADLGSNRNSASASQVWLSNGECDAADVGSCGIYQIAALGLGGPRVRYDRRGPRSFHE